MKMIYVDCSMGAAGDMLMSALLELRENQEGFIQRMNDLNIPGVKVSLSKAVKCGITGLHVTVKVKEEEEKSVDIDHFHGYVHRNIAEAHFYTQEHRSELHLHAQEHVDGGHIHTQEHIEGEHNHSHEHIDGGNSHTHEHIDTGNSHTHEHIDTGHSHTHEHTDAEHSHTHEHTGAEHSHTHEHTEAGHTHTHEHIDAEHIHTHEHQEGLPIHSHTGMEEIKNIVNALNLSDKVRSDVLEVYGLIANAESQVHGVSVDQIHFHEVGSMDAVTDIIGVCMLMEELAPEQMIVSPIHVGSGHVKCSHGILPVPAPATAYILQGIPMYGGSIKGELCTPTGAALLKHFATSFGDMPVIKVSSIGRGMGNKDFEVANCVIAYLGQTQEVTSDVTEISCNLDDMTPEAIGFVQELLFEKGALEVYTTPIGMKKSRPGIMLTCMCHPEQVDRMSNLMLRHTTTLGVRITQSRRVILERFQTIQETELGTIRIKHAIGENIEKSKPEYDDIAKIARENNLTFAEVMDRIKD
ncbi:MAG: nickel pincer cofactor biosynthesis protein LarC [Mobilitalea sp.]